MRQANFVQAQTSSSANTTTMTVYFEPPLPIVTLPWKCLVPDNQRHDVLRVKGGGRRIGLTDKYRRALGAASLLASHQWGQRPTMRDKVCVTITLYEPDKRRRDVSNYLKMAMDALVRVCFVDDSQIDKLTVIRGELSRVNPRAEIEIRPL